MRQQSLQLRVKGGGQAYDWLTQMIERIVGDMNNVSPEFDSFYNPIRAGSMTFSLQLIDVYGQKRQVDITKLIRAASMTPDAQSPLAPSAIYMPPRLTQPSRLLFRWLAANSPGLDEMNAHPATSPICGWLLPNHLQGNFFIYNRQGAPLGSLRLNGAQTQVIWEPAPGNMATLHESIESVFQDENPHLRQLVIAINKGPSAFFSAFLHAVDTAQSCTIP